MADSALQRIVESLNQDLEEKIYQLSQVRQVAEAVSRGIHESHYFSQLCNDFIPIFDAGIVCLFWHRTRAPQAWWLDSWASNREGVHPIQHTIPEEEEGIFGWIKRLKKPHFLEDASGEAFAKIWSGNIPQKTTAAIIPVSTEDNRTGMMVLLDPISKLTSRSAQLQLEILGSLVISGVHNRLLYRDLQESEEEFRDLFDNSSDMVLVSYPDGVIRECNTVFRQKLGLRANPQGSVLSNLISDTNSPDFQECWDKLVHGHSVQNVNIHLRRHDGSLLEAELSGNVRLAGEGEPGLIRLYLRDVTQRHEAERRQRELELEIELVRERQLAQVGLYVSGIAHNLQNPVQVLLGYLELLKFRGVKIPELNIIEQSTQSIMLIIRNLLDKMQKERNPETTEVDINELLNGELTFLNANSYFKHEISKKYQFGEGVPKVRGVYSDFSQAVMNIVYNALDSMRDSEVKELRVKSWYNADQDLIKVSISDTGSGIPEEVRDHIFKPFFTTKKHKGDVETGFSSGSGLGLSSAVSLLKAYNGNISFESGAGKGTTFTISIPPYRPEPGAGA